MESTKKKTKKTNQFSNFAEYKGNTKQRIVFLYTSNEQLEMEGLKNTIYNSTKNHRKNKYKSNKICAKPIY